MLAEYQRTDDLFLREHHRQEYHWHVYQRAVRIHAAAVCHHLMAETGVCPRVHDELGIWLDSPAAFRCACDQIRRCELHLLEMGYTIDRFDVAVQSRIWCGTCTQAELDGHAASSAEVRQQMADENS